MSLRGHRPDRLTRDWMKVRRATPFFRHTFFVMAGLDPAIVHHRSEAIFADRTCELPLEIASLRSQ
jgi:hypothetical protein